MNECFLWTCGLTDWQTDAPSCYKSRSLRFFFFLFSYITVATNDDDPFDGCSCKTFADNVKGDIEELREFCMLAIERRPELCQKVADTVFHKIAEEIMRPLEQLGEECDKDGYVNVLSDSDIGCEAANHHCVCGK